MIYFVKGSMVIMVYSEVRDFFVGIIEAYGRTTFMVMAVLLMSLFCCCAYYFFIKPLHDDIVVYRSTVVRVSVLKKKFEPLLQDVTLLGGSTTNVQNPGPSKADIAGIIDRALDYGLVVESSVCRPQNKSEQTMITLRGSFENFMRFLGGMSFTFAKVSLQENQAGIFAQLTVISSVSDSGLKENV